MTYWLAIYLPQGQPMSNEIKKLILCVDDDDDTCEMLKTTLGLAGYEIVTAKSTPEGLQKAKTNQFDLYILDGHLPVSSGIELCRQIRNYDAQTPIIFFSATAR